MNNCTHDNDDHYFHRDAPYIEPDYYANNANKNMPILSTIARGPQGDGVYAEVIASNEDTFIYRLVNDVTGETVIQSPNLSAGKLTISQTDANPEEGVLNHAVFTVTRGGIASSYDVTIPPGSTGSRVYTISGIVGKRDDDLYQWQVGDLVYDGHENWTSKPVPRIYDIVMFTCAKDARGFFAVGVVRSVEGGQIIVTCQTYAELLAPHIGENGNWWIGDHDTGIKAQGPKGDKGSFLPPKSKSLPTGSAPTVKDLSTDPTIAQLEFGIPEGSQGEEGAKATFKAPHAKTLAAGSEATVRDLSDDTSVAEYEFGIPEGHTYTPSGASATTVEPGEPATARIEVNQEDHQMAFRFELPKGEPGASLNIRDEVMTPDTLPPFDETPINEAYIVDDGDGRRDLYIRGVYPLPAPKPGAPWTVVEDWEGKPAVIGEVTGVREPYDAEVSVVVTKHEGPKENRYDFEFHLPTVTKLDLRRDVKILTDGVLYIYINFETNLKDVGEQIVGAVRSNPGEQAGWFVIGYNSQGNRTGTVNVQSNTLMTTDIASLLLDKDSEDRGVKYISIQAQLIYQKTPTISSSDHFLIPITRTYSYAEYGMYLKADVPYIVPPEGSSTPGGILIEAISTLTFKKNVFDNDLFFAYYMWGTEPGNGARLIKSTVVPWSKTRNEIPYRFLFKDDGTYEDASFIEVRVQGTDSSDIGNNDSVAPPLYLPIEMPSTDSKYDELVLVAYPPFIDIEKNSDSRIMAKNNKSLAVVSNWDVNAISPDGTEDDISFFNKTSSINLKSSDFLKEGKDAGYLFIRISCSPTDDLFKKRETIIPILRSVKIPAPEIAGQNKLGVVKTIPESSVQVAEDGGLISRMTHLSGPTTISVKRGPAGPYTWIAVNDMDEPVNGSFQAKAANKEGLSHPIAFESPEPSKIKINPDQVLSSSDFSIYIWFYPEDKKLVLPVYLEVHVVQELPTASKQQFGVVRAQEGRAVTVDRYGYLDANVATEITPGIVKPDGTTIKVTTDGTLSAAGTTPPAPYVLPIASTATLGGVKVKAGSPLTVAADGTMDVAIPEPIPVTPIATTAVVGKVKPDGSTITVDAAGLIKAVAPAIPEKGITTEKIADGSITNVKLAESSVGNTNLLNQSITEGKLSLAVLDKLNKPNNTSVYLVAEKPFMIRQSNDSVRIFAYSSIPGAIVSGTWVVYAWKDSGERIPIELSQESVTPGWVDLRYDRNIKDADTNQPHLVFLDIRYTPTGGDIQNTVQIIIPLLAGDSSVRIIQKQPVELPYYKSGMIKDKFAAVDKDNRPLHLMWTVYGTTKRGDLFVLAKSTIIEAEPTWNASSLWVVKDDQATPRNIDWFIVDIQGPSGYYAEAFPLNKHPHVIGSSEVFDVAAYGLYPEVNVNVWNSKNSPTAKSFTLTNDLGEPSTRRRRIKEINEPYREWDQYGSGPWDQIKGLYTEVIPALIGNAHSLPPNIVRLLKTGSSFYGLVSIAATGTLTMHASITVQGLCGPAGGAPYNFVVEACDPGTGATWRNTYQLGGTAFKLLYSEKTFVGTGSVVNWAGYEPAASPMVLKSISGMF